MNWWGLNPERENSSEEDPWHEWHMPEKASGMEVVAAAAVAKPTEPLILPLRINCGHSTTSC